MLHEQIGRPVGAATDDKVRPAIARYIARGYGRTVLRKFVQQRFLAVEVNKIRFLVLIRQTERIGQVAQQRLHDRWDGFRQPTRPPGVDRQGLIGPDVW